MFRHRIALPAIIVLASACSTSQKTETAPIAPETKAVAKAEDVSYVTDVKFAKGSDAISTAARADLDRLLANAAAAGKIDGIKVLTWGDAEYPADAQKELPRAQRELVNKRNRAMKDYIKAKTNNVSIDTYSMAERPGAMAKLFNTSDARLKKSLERAGMPDTTTARTNANASKSTVMLVMDKD